MRKYSIYEQRIIREKLLEGSTLRQMFSPEFVQNARLEIMLDSEHENHIFKYFSDSFNVNRAVEELVNLVNLVKLLERDGLIRKYFRPSTSLYDFDDVDSIEIGESQSKTSLKFILPVGSEADLVSYLYSNLDKNFRATQELRSMVGANFESPEEKRHDDAIRQSKTANKIALLSAVAAFIAMALSIFGGSDNDDLRRQIKSNETDLINLRNKIKTDSASNSVVRQKIEDLQSSFDSLKVPK
jgi:hypothetical protein